MCFFFNSSAWFTLVGASGAQGFALCPFYCVGRPRQRGRYLKAKDGSTCSRLPLAMPALP